MSAQQVTLSQVFANTANTFGTPANSTSTVVEQGTIWADSSYLYISVANNIVKRVAISTF